MKKAIALLLVLCVAASLFAIGSVKIGPAFNFVTGKTRDFKNGDTTYLKSETKYKTNGIGFDISGKYELAGNLSVWADFNMVFCADGKYKSELDSTWTSCKDEYEQLKKADLSAKKKINVISIGAGVAYKLPLTNVPVEVNVGGGVFLERMIAEVNWVFNKTYCANTIKATNIGVAGYAEAEYKFNGNWGVGLTIMPHIGLLDFAKWISTEGNVANTSKANGFAFSFSMPIVIGASYSF